MLNSRTYRLRTAMIVVTVACVVASGVYYYQLLRTERLRKQESARRVSTFEYETLGNASNCLRGLSCSDDGHIVDLSYHNLVVCLNDSDMKAICSLPELKYLQLAGQTGITDAGADELRRCTQLEYLDLQSCNVSNQTVDVLGSLHNLRIVCIGGTKIDRDGERRLRSLLPNTTIYGDE